MRAARAGRWHQLFSLFRLLTLIFEAARRVQLGPVHRRPGRDRRLATAVKAPPRHPKGFLVSDNLDDRSSERSLLLCSEPKPALTGKRPHEYKPDSGVGGTLVYHFRDKIPYSPYLFALCVALSLIRNLSFFGPWKDALFLFPVSYMTAYIGLLPIRRLPLFSGGDYSYGIYLYGYPLQQMLIQLHPRLPIALHSLCSIALATGVAMISWHCTEKRSSDCAADLASPLIRAKRIQPCRFPKQMNQ